MLPKFSFMGAFTAEGLYIAQASPNLFGPMPNIKLSLSTDLATSIVAQKERLLSLFLICKAFGKILPMEDCPDIKNKSAIMIITKENTGKLRGFSSSSEFSTITPPSAFFLPEEIEIL